MPSLAFVGYGLWAATGFGGFLWIGPVVILVIVPAIDLLTGLDRSNPPDDVIEALEQDRYYRWITYLFLPIQYVGFVGAFWLLANGDPLGLQGDLSTLDKVGLAISIGCIGGIGINTAHELGHKKESNERWLSKIALAQSFYGHFYIEHNRGHHVRVATPEDPASARMGENFYQFWPRTVGGSLKSAWRLEKRRIARRGKHPFRIGNDVLNAWLMSAVLWGGADRLARRRDHAVPPDPGGRRLLAARGRQLHGALRHAPAEGRVRGARSATSGSTPAHSWNSNNVATNVLLYHLQRHSDHHANPTRRYQALRDFEESPVLPTGYAGMIVLAIVPAGVAPGDGPAGARSLRRRPEPRQPQPAQAGPDPGEVPATRRILLRAVSEDPGAGAGRRGRGAGGPVSRVRLHLRGRGRRRARGLRRRHRLGGHPRLLVLPRLRGPREARLRPGPPSGGLMRIVVDRDLCEGHGMCEAMAHEFFELDDEDEMHVLDETPGEEHRGQLAAATASCPVLALSLEG